MKLRTRSIAGMKDVEVVEVEKESRSGGFQAPQARESVTVLSSAFSTILGPFFPGRKLSRCNFMRAKSPTSGELTPPFVEANERDMGQREAKLGGKGEEKSQEQNGMAAVDTEDKGRMAEKMQASDQNGMTAVDTDDKCYLPVEEAEKKQAWEQHGMAAGDKGGYGQGRVKRSETPPSLSSRTPVIMGPPVLPKIYVTKACTSHCRGSDKKRKALSAPVPVLHTRKFDMFEGYIFDKGQCTKRVRLTSADSEKLWRFKKTQARLLLSGMVSRWSEVLSMGRHPMVNTDLMSLLDWARRTKHASTALRQGFLREF